MRSANPRPRADAAGLRPTPAIDRVSAEWHSSRMRSVEVLELASEMLPRRWVRRAGVIVVLALLASGTFNEPAGWYVREKAAALQESLVEPILERFIEQLATPSQTP